MEHNVVLSYKVNESGILALPPRLPRVGQQLARIGDIAYRSIKPDIHHLAFGTFHRHGDAPIEVAAYGTRLQTHVEPALALPIDIAAPFGMTFQNPLLKPGLVFVEWQVPVFRLAQHWRGATDGTLRVDEFGGRETSTALLALVAVCAFAVAVRTFACDIPVGEEGLCLLVVILLTLLFHKLAFFVELAEKLCRGLGVYLARCAAVDVEADAEALEAVFYQVVITVHHVLRSDAFLAGAYGNGHSVFIAAADKKHVASSQAEISHVDISRHIHSSQMANMHTAVCIRQRRRNECALKIFLCHIFLFFSFSEDGLT